MQGMKISGVQITQLAASRVLETVLDAGHTHGLGYWGTVTNIRRRGERIIAFTVTENEVYTGQRTPRSAKITTAEIGPAICALLNHQAGGWAKQILNDEIDGPVSDAIIQYACFGQELYA